MYFRISKGPPAGGRERAPAPARRIVTEGRSRMYSEGGARGGGRGRGSAGGARGGGRRSATAQTVSPTESDAAVHCVKFRDYLVSAFDDVHSIEFGY